MRNPNPPPIPVVVVKAKTRARRRTAKAVPAQPHYDDGQSYDSGLHYAVEDPVPPPPGKARVRLELGPRTDSDLAAFAEAHVAAMDGNPNFTTPVPSAVVFGQWLSDFETLMAEVENARVLLKNLTEQKDAARAGLQGVFTQRGHYVETAANGNPDVIATSGLPLRRPPTPVGQLHWPENLRVETTQYDGQMVVRWNTVSHARAFLLQYAEVVEGEPRDWKQAYLGGKLTFTMMNLTPGKTYEFRVAALGGTTGQSYWSPTVFRMAA